MFDALVASSQFSLIYVQRDLYERLKVNCSKILNNISQILNKILRNVKKISPKI